MPSLVANSSKGYGEGKAGGKLSGTSECSIWAMLCAQECYFLLSYYIYPCNNAKYKWGMSGTMKDTGRL